LDARTLPAGWIMSPRDEGGSPNEFGLVPTAALDVKVDAASDSTTAGPGFRFGGVTIAVVDSAGSEVGRAHGHTARAVRRASRRIVPRGGRGRRCQ
jgi:hypothetical protein